MIICSFFVFFIIFFVLSSSSLICRVLPYSLFVIISGLFAVFVLIFVMLHEFIV